MSAVWNFLSAPWAETFMWSLLHFLWLGALWTALGVILVHSGMVTRSEARHNVWLVLLLLMGATPPVTFAWWQLETGERLDRVDPSSSSAARESQLDETERPDDILIWSDEGQAGWSLASPAWPVARPLLGELSRWQPLILLGWLSGVAVCSLRVLVGAWWVRQVSRALQPCPASWRHRAGKLASALKLPSLPRLGVSQQVIEPVAVHLWRPAVILPASWLSEMPADMLEAVIAHELAHIRRHDLWVNLCQRVIEAVLFFHPCVWWVSRQIRWERELCCDALAVQATGRAVDYARALEWVAEWRLARASLLLGTGLGGTRMGLLQRVKRVLGLDVPKESSGWVWGAASLGAVVLGVACTLSWTVSAQGEEEDPSAVASDNVSPKLEGVLLAQREDEDRPPPRRPEGPPRDGERRPEGRPRDGERPADGERGPRRPEGDRRPEGPPREGVGPRPPYGPFGEGGFRAPPMEAMQDMLQAIRELREEVRRLRAELEELRAERRGGPPFREGGPRPEFRDGPPFREREGEFRPPQEGPRPPREAGRERGPRPPEEARPRPRPDDPAADREAGRPRRPDDADNPERQRERREREGDRD